MSLPTFRYEDVVRSNWVDYNGHMNDAAYAQAFSLSLEAFMDHIRLDEAGREEYSYTIYTLETHLCYLQEAMEKEVLYIEVQLIDLDDKRLHIFCTMRNKKDTIIATSEQMLMGIDTRTERPSSFPAPVQEILDDIWRVDQAKEQPVQLGRTIGIRRK